MPFTQIPPRLSAPKRTKHTELVAVLGQVGRDNDFLIAPTHDAVHFQVKVSGTPWRNQLSSWTWGAAEPVVLPAGGALFAAREDGLIITEGGEDDEGRTLFDVWRGTQKSRTVTGTGFGLFAPSGQIIHGRLCLASLDKGLVIVDIDTGARLHTLVPRTKVIDYSKGVELPTPLSFGAAPEGGIAVCEGRSIAIHDLQSGEKRGEFQGPHDRTLRELAISPDGAFALVGTEDPRDPPRSGFIAMDLKTGQVTELLAPQKPSRHRVAWVANGRIAVTSTDEGIVHLWEATTWKLLETLKLEPGNDYRALDVYGWDAHQALVVKGMRGLAYVFTVSAEPLADAPPAGGKGKAAKGSPKAAKPARPAAGPSQVAPAQWPEKAWPFVLGAEGEDAFGGLPAGFTTKSWPVCGGCEEPMVAVLSLGAHPERLPLRMHEALTLFLCGACETFEPFGGKNAAVLVSSKARKGKPLATPPAGVEGRPEVLEPRKLIYRSASSDDAVDQDKLGGTPDWLQGDETPACTTCQAKMQFVAQLSEELEPFLNFGSGRGYLFVCRDEHDARFLWQQ